MNIVIVGAGNVGRALGGGWRKAGHKVTIAVRDLAGGKVAELKSQGFDIAAAAPRAADNDVRVLGPAEAPLALVRGRYRFRLLVKSPRAFDLSAYLRQWLMAAPKPKGNLKLEVDVDPQSFL